MTDRITKLFGFTAAMLTAVLLIAAEGPSGSNAGMELSATSANVSGAPENVRFEIVRWSTDAERDHLMKAWELKLEEPEGRGKGSAKGKGKAAPKGKGRGPAEEEEPRIPEAELAKALQETATVGYLWPASKLAGYALRYAGKVENPDGSQRIVLITQHPLGELDQLWNPAFPGGRNDYEFSVIELRLDANGKGTGKASLAGKVAADPGAKMVALENYNALPVVFADIRPAEQP